MEQEVQQQQNQEVVEDNTSNVSQENTEETKVDLSGVEVMSNGKEVDLSDFSVVYHKLYLISYLSSTRCIAFNPQKKPAYREASIRKVLDTKKMYV